MRKQNEYAAKLLWRPTWCFRSKGYDFQYLLNNYRELTDGLFVSCCLDTRDLELGRTADEAAYK